MTRKWFLSLIGIGAAGQTPVPMSTIKPLCGKPANGECPVCGTMAEPYKGEPVTYVIKCTHWLSPTCTFEPVYIASDPRIVRCAHCNAAFWQDSEGAK